MKNRDQVINWIAFSLAQDSNNLTETFYFDQLKKEFFSIHILDYLMVNENLEIDHSAKVSYPEETQKEIVDWIIRLEKNDSSIIRIPKNGLTDEKLKEIRALEFINENNIDLEKVKVWEVESNVSVTVDLTNENDKNPSEKKWWEFWK